MERLTARQAIKHADGTSHIVTYCHGHRYGPAAFPDKYGTSNPQEYENYCEMVDRLAAYEDIGTVEDFQKFVTAQNEGRLVELPCKVGDKIYRIVEMSKHSAYKDFVPTVPDVAAPFGIPVKNLFGGYSIIPIDDFGKTVFLTREEAESALAKECEGEK